MKRRNERENRKPLRMRTIKTTVNPDLVINLIIEFMSKSSFIHDNEEVDLNSVIVDWSDAPFKIQFNAKEV